MNNQTTTATPTADRQTANLESPHTLDFGILAAKAIVETAQTFLNESLVALAEMHKGDTETRCPEQFNRQLSMLPLNQIEKIIQSLRSNLAVNPAYYSTLILKQGVPQSSQNTQTNSKVSTSSTQSTLPNPSQASLCPIECFVDGLLEQHMAVYYGGKGAGKGRERGATHQESRMKAKDEEQKQYLEDAASSRQPTKSDSDPMPSQTQQPSTDEARYLTTWTILLLIRLHLNVTRLESAGAAGQESAREDNSRANGGLKRRLAVKRIEKTISKLDKQIKENISTIQLKYDMLQFECEDNESSQSSQFKQLAPDFATYLQNYCISLFEEKIPTQLLQIFLDLDLSDSITESLQNNKRSKKQSAKKQQSGLLAATRVRPGEEEALANSNIQKNGQGLQKKNPPPPCSSLSKPKAVQKNVGYSAQNKPQKLREGERVLPTAEIGLPANSERLKASESKAREDHATGSGSKQILKEQDGVKASQTGQQIHCIDLGSASGENRPGDLVSQNSHIVDSSSKMPEEGMGALGAKHNSETAKNQPLCPVSNFSACKLDQISNYNTPRKTDRDDDTGKSYSQRFVDDRKNLQSSSKQPSSKKDMEQNLSSAKKNLLQKRIFPQKQEAVSDADDHQNHEKSNKKARKSQDENRSSSVMLAMQGRTSPESIQKMNTITQTQTQSKSKQRMGKENGISDVMRQDQDAVQTTKTSKMSLSHFIQVKKAKDAQKSVLAQNINLLNQKYSKVNSGEGSGASGEASRVIGDKQNDAVEQRSKSVANINGHSSSANLVAIHSCFQNQTSLKKGAPTRRFKAQDITTSKPKSKQNFICQQTQATYNLYKMSSKSRLDKKGANTLATSLSRKKNSITQLTVGRTNDDHAPKAPNFSFNTAKTSSATALPAKKVDSKEVFNMLSNSLLIEGSSKNKQGSVLNRLKSRAEQRKAAAGETNAESLQSSKAQVVQQQSCEVVQTQSSSNDKSSLGKLTQQPQNQITVLSEDKDFKQQQSLVLSKAMSGVTTVEKGQDDTGTPGTVGQTQALFSE